VCHSMTCVRTLTVKKILTRYFSWGTSLLTSVNVDRSQQTMHDLRTELYFSLTTPTFNQLFDIRELARVQYWKSNESSLAVPLRDSHEESCAQWKFFRCTAVYNAYMIVYVGHCVLSYERKMSCEIVTVVSLRSGYISTAYRLTLVYAAVSV